MLKRIKNGDQEPASFAEFGLKRKEPEKPVKKPPVKPVKRKETGKKQQEVTPAQRENILEEFKVRRGGLNRSKSRVKEITKRIEGLSKRLKLIKDEKILEDVEDRIRLLEKEKTKENTRIKTGTKELEELIDNNPSVLAGKSIEPTFAEFGLKRREKVAEPKKPPKTAETAAKERFEKFREELETKRKKLTTIREEWAKQFKQLEKAKDRLKKGLLTGNFSVLLFAQMRENIKKMVKSLQEKKSEEVKAETEINKFVKEQAKAENIAREAEKEPPSLTKAGLRRKTEEELKEKEKPAPKKPAGKKPAEKKEELSPGERRKRRNLIRKLEFQEQQLETEIKSREKKLGQPGAVGPAGIKRMKEDLKKIREQLKTVSGGKKKGGFVPNAYWARVRELEKGGKEEGTAKEQAEEEMKKKKPEKKQEGETPTTFAGFGLKRKDGYNFDAILDQSEFRIFNFIRLKPHEGDSKSVSEWIAHCIRKHVKGGIKPIMKKEQCVAAGLQKGRAGELQQDCFDAYYETDSKKLVLLDSNHHIIKSIKIGDVNMNFKRKETKTDAKIKKKEGDTRTFKFVSDAEQKAMAIAEARAQFAQIEKVISESGANISESSRKQLTESMAALKRYFAGGKPTQKME